MRYLNLLFVFVLSVMIGACGGGSVNEWYVDRTSNYDKLISMYPELSPGFGRDIVDALPSNQPETLANIIKFESIVGRNSNISRNALVQLLEMSDLDGDGLAGYGISQAWDAFGDGSLNSKDQVYLVSNAIVLDGLLYALGSNTVPSNYRSRVEKLVHDLIVNSLLYYTRTDVGGWYWYSSSVNDSIYVPNVSAYLMGLNRKATYLFPLLFSSSERLLINERSDEVMRTLVSTVRLINDVPYWAYFSNNFYTHPNDLIHHCYITLGIYNYKRYGGSVDAFDKDVLVRSLLSYVEEKSVMEYPIGMREINPTLLSIPARVWGPGFLAETLHEMGEHQYVNDLLDTVINEYGDFPDVQYYPIRYASGYPDFFYSRIASFLLAPFAMQSILIAK